MQPSKRRSRRCAAGRSTICPSRSPPSSFGCCWSGSGSCGACKARSRTWKSRSARSCRRPTCKPPNRPCATPWKWPSRPRPARRRSCCGARAARARACWPAPSMPAARRAAGPFITVPCPSLSAELLESELFGHVQGAFTGAVRDTTGKVAAAESGTLFLDEIGDLPLALQPKLLRLLQERCYERIGETHDAGQQRPHPGGHQSQPGGGAGRRPLPRRPLLSPQRHRSDAAAAAGAAAGHPAPGRAPAALLRPAKRQGDFRLCRRRCARRSYATGGRATSASCATWSSAASILASGPLVEIADLPALLGSPEHRRRDRLADARTSRVRARPPHRGRHGHHGRGGGPPGHRSQHALQKTKTLWNLNRYNFMNLLTAFGLFAVTAMLLCYALEDRHTAFILGFAVACAGIGIWFSSRSVAFRSCRGRLVFRRDSTLVAEKMTRNTSWSSDHDPAPTNPGCHAALVRPAGRAGGNGRRSDLPPRPSDRPNPPRELRQRDLHARSQRGPGAHRLLLPVRPGRPRAEVLPAIPGRVEVLR